LGHARHAPRLALLLLLLAGPAPAAPAAEAEVLRAEALRARASVDADVGVLRGLLAEELRFTHSNGRTTGRTGLLDDLASGRLDYLSIRPGEVAAHVYGQAAVVTGSAELEVRAGGGDVQAFESLFTAVYVRRDGAWQLVAYQSTRAPAATVPSCAPSSP
jgi:hypothetical protein